MCGLDARERSMCGLHAQACLGGLRGQALWLCLELAANPVHTVLRSTAECIWDNPVLMKMWWKVPVSTIHSHFV